MAGQLRRNTHLWDSSKRDDGTMVESCTILTMPAHSMMAEIHNAPGKQRMPVILDRRRVDAVASSARGQRERCGGYRLGRLPRIVKAIFTVSKHNQRHLQFAFPNAKLFRMYSYIDVKRFRFAPLSRKEKIIVFVCKAMGPTMVLYHSLAARAVSRRNTLQGYDFRFLTGMTEEEVAQLLERAQILVMLNTQEGLPRTVLEGMASGCVVVTFNTGCFDELREGTVQFDHDDLVAVATTIEDIAVNCSTERWQRLALRARAHAELCSLDRQSGALLGAWAEVLRNQL